VSLLRRLTNQPLNFLFKNLDLTLLLRAALLIHCHTKMKLTFIILLSALTLKAQIDSCIAVSMVGIHLGAQVPGADLAKRFGPNLNAGGVFMHKTKKNWLLGIESNYMYGRNVKEDVLSQLRTSNGTIIDNEGFPADLRITERGLGVHAVFGKVLPFLSANPNSGIMLTVGGGYFQTKINLYDAQRKIAAINGELKSGYDRLSNGFSATQFLGYLFLSESRMLNFYFGMEAYQAVTSSVRKMNYDTGMPDTAQRLELLYGLRFGWILPLYERKPSAFYFD
jgi:hypothetical protein